MPFPDKGKCNALSFVFFGLPCFGLIVTNFVYLFKLQWREELFLTLSPCHYGENGWLWGCQWMLQYVLLTCVNRSRSRPVVLTGWKNPWGSWSQWILCWSHPQIFWCSRSGVGPRNLHFKSTPPSPPWFWSSWSLDHNFEKQCSRHLWLSLAHGEGRGQINVPD